MKVCVGIRHVYFESLGSFAKPIEEAGYCIKYLDACSENLDLARSADLVIFLGGPISVNDEYLYPFIANEISIAKDRINQKKPTIGICFGAQLIAKALGSKVYPGTKGKEIGWSEVILTKEGRESPISPLQEAETHMFHWHGDTFDLPTGATLLATSKVYRNQVYHISNYVLAFQCHPELNYKEIEYWLVGHANELSNDKVSLSKIREETLEFGPTLERRGRQVIKNWLIELENGK